MDLNPFQCNQFKNWLSLHFPQSGKQSNPSHSVSCYILCSYGELSERFKEPVLKTGDGETHREFESHTLRQKRSAPGVRIFFLDTHVILNKKGKGSAYMAVRLNDDKEMVQMVKDGLKRTGGYCPCRLERTEENKCICKEFREQIADPNFQGFCHCMLYYKD